MRREALHSNQTLHLAPKSEIIGQAHAGGATFVSVRRQHGRNDFSFVLHVWPAEFTLSGLQRPTLLRHLGFGHSACSFTGAGECYAREVPADFDVAAFAAAFGDAYSQLIEAERQLSTCQFFIPDREGLASFMNGLPSSRAVRGRNPGDGHTAEIIKSMKITEDASFGYRLTSLTRGETKGWIFHYAPAHRPASPTVESTLRFLQLCHHDGCPEFDFEDCWWRFVPLHNDPFSPMGFTYNEVVHGGFASHPEHFTAAVEALAEADLTVRRFGVHILPLPSDRAARDSQERDMPSPQKAKHGWRYDVALSFAGPQRALAEQLALRLRDQGHTVFYDDFYPEQLWGEDLPVKFEQVYRQDSRFCVIFASEEYLKRMWTIHERRMVTARLIEERGNTYVLPIKVEDVELPGIPSTIGYLSLAIHSIEEVGDILLRKLAAAR